MPTTPLYVIDADAVAGTSFLASGDEVTSISVAGGMLTASGGNGPIYYGPVSPRAIGGKGVISGDNGTKHIGGVISNLGTLLSGDYTLTFLVRAHYDGGFNCLCSQGNGSTGMLLLMQGISSDVEDMVPILWGNFLGCGERFYEGAIATMTLTVKSSGDEPYMAWWVNGLPCGLLYATPRSINLSDPFVLFASNSGDFGGKWDICRLRMYDYALSPTDDKALTMAQEDAELIGENLRNYAMSAWTLGFGDSVDYGYYSDETTITRDSGLGSSGTVVLGSRNSFIRRAHQALCSRDGKTYRYSDWGRPGRTINDLTQSYEQSIMPLLTHLYLYEIPFRLITLGEGYNSASDSNFNSKIDSIISSIKSLSTPPTLLAIRNTPYPAGRDATTKAQYAAFNAHFASTDYSTDAPEGLSIVKMDIQSVAMSVYGDGYTTSEIHPSESGHQIIANGVDSFEGYIPLWLASVPPTLTPPNGPQVTLKALAGGVIGPVWQAVAGATSYKVERKIAGEDFTTLSEETTDISWPDVEIENVPLNTLTYRITAKNSSGGATTVVRIGGTSGTSMSPSPALTVLP